jgi:hypothetical protein
MYALMALRGDTGPAGNVVSGGAFCLWALAVLLFQRNTAS